MEQRIEESTTAPAATSAALNPRWKKKRPLLRRARMEVVYKSFDERNPSSSTFV